MLEAERSVFILKVYQKLSTILNKDSIASNNTLNLIKRGAYFYAIILGLYK